MSVVGVSVRSVLIGALAALALGSTSVGPESQDAGSAGEEDPYRIDPGQPWSQGPFM